MADLDGTDRQTNEVVALGRDLDMRDERGTCWSGDSLPGASVVLAELLVDMLWETGMCCSEHRAA